ncbi:Tetratricopeptide repeat protein [Planctomycetes bacterium CA13]|uniref:Tetratricopeptide repeat protein n=1 Tax=Novipirellula herctigrandis TaxID=2527986 RepID=A0A5C5Z2U0_9BACT|nr:Tetratricopeptide repeat protein [Planctomycetes bacterium CA13]
MDSHLDTKSVNPNRKDASNEKASLSAGNASAQNLNAQHGTDDSSSPVESQQYLDKIQQRQFDWQWNGRLLWISTAIAAILVVCSIASYVYHSKTTTQTYRSRADEAASEGKFSDQAKWLQRYLLIQPDDTGAIIEMAIASDQAADVALSSELSAAVNQARKHLGSSIARLTDDEAKEAKDLRHRLIKRLIQLGGGWFREAERQVVVLDAEHTDPQANKWMALSLIGQVDASISDARQADKYDKEKDFWLWRSHQKPGEVLVTAISMNPNDVDLIAKLVEAAIRTPQSFDLSGKDAQQRAAGLNQRVEKLLAGIENNQDSRSRLIRYRFELARGNTKLAEEILFSAAEDAAARLAKQMALLVAERKKLEDAGDGAVGDEVDTETAEQATAPEQALVPDAEGSPEYWDFVLLSEAAGRASETDPQLARSYFDQLTVTRIPSVSAALVENVFVLSGQLAQSSGDPDGAIEIWERGLVQGNPLSLDLLGAISRLNVFLAQVGQAGKDEAINHQGLGNVTSDSSVQNNQQRVITAEKSLERFREAIKAATRRVAKASDSELPRETRLAVGRQIEAANWRLQVLESTLAALDKRDVDAIQGMQRALVASAEVGTDERVAVALQLASLYQTQGLWDQVGATLDQAIELAPSNLSLRAKSADAWTRSGNRLRAIEQWRSVGNADSFEIQVAGVEARLNYQLRLRPEQQDFSGVRSAIARVRKKYEEPIEQLIARTKDRGLYKEPSDVSLADDEQTDESVGQAEPMDPADAVALQLLSRLQISEISLPPAGVDIQEHLRSSQMAEQIAELAEQNADDELIQAFAAERLAAAGMLEQSDEAIKRLERLSKPQANSLAQSTPPVIVRARIEAAQGKPIEACHRLMRHAETLAQNEGPLVASQLLQTAAGFALMGNDSELAYNALLKIPADQQTITILFSLARLSRQLPPNSEIFQSKNQSNDPSSLSLHWERELEKIEGRSGSFWRFLAITRLIDQLRSDRNEIQRNDARLREARTQLRELMTIRPRWGEAISLEGWLLAIEGKPEQAVDQLRRGIAAGDTRMQTRVRLWEQLVALGRLDEADVEIQQTALASGQPSAQFEVTRIQLAQQQGDFGRSVEMARQAAVERPDDALAQLVLARVATVAAADPSQLESQDELLQEARQAIGKAASDIKANPVQIASARLAVELVAGDEKVIRKEIERIRQSKLDELEKLILVSQAFVALKDFEAALPLLKRADQIQPSSRTQIALSALYRELSRTDDEIDALRIAQQRDPNNTILRNQLAQALAARDGKEINWQELSQLLQSADQATGINRFLYAILLSVHGNDKQHDQSVQILRELIAEQNSRSEDAARVLAAVLRRQLEAIPASDAGGTESDAGEVERLSSEIRSIYDSISRNSSPEVADLYRYADFLLRQGDDRDLAKVKTLLDQMHQRENGELAALELDIRYAERTGQRDKAPEIIKQWADSANDGANLTDSDVSAIAGGSLIKLGFIEEGLSWFEQAYKNEPETLTNYVVALGRVGQLDVALQVTAEHHQKNKDPNSAILLAELLLNQSADEMSTEHNQLVDQAVESFDRNPMLLESVATLRMQQSDYERAIELYQRAIQIDPLRVRTLNNLAMAFSEVPGRELEGIEPIDKAMTLAGENPELLDTKGVLLLKARQFAQAKKTFQMAISQSTEPRYQFHLVLTLLAEGNEAEAEREWGNLNLGKLNPGGLTVPERQTLAELEIRFGK